MTMLRLRSGLKLLVACYGIWCECSRSCFRNSWCYPRDDSLVLVAYSESGNLCLGRSWCLLHAHEQGRVSKTCISNIEHTALHAGLLGRRAGGNQVERGLQELQGLVCRAKNQVTRLHEAFVGPCTYRNLQNPSPCNP